MEHELARIQRWLDDMSISVATRDLGAHMALVSPNVRVYGLPGKNDSIGYADWERRRRHELSSGLLSRLDYESVRIKTIALRRLVFSVTEYMHAQTGAVVEIEKNIVLEHEDDRCWRVVEEVIGQWKKHRAEPAAA